MTDLLSYSLTDFLPFSRETYLRLFEIYNARFALAVAAGLLFGGWVLWMLRRADAGRVRWCLVGLAACWFWVAWAFQSQSYRPLNWAAGYFAAGFVLQGLLLAAVTVALGRDGPLCRSGAAAELAYGLIVVAVLVMPILGLFSGRPWSGLEWFGSAPDPTAVATLGLVLMLRTRLRPLLMIVPAAWCVVSGLTLLALQDSLWPLLPGVLLVAIAASVWQDLSACG